MGIVPVSNLIIDYSTYSNQLKVCLFCSFSWYYKNKTNVQLIFSIFTLCEYQLICCFLVVFFLDFLIYETRHVAKLMFYCFQNLLSKLHNLQLYRTAHCARQYQSYCWGVFFLVQYDNLATQDVLYSMSQKRVEY